MTSDAINPQNNPATEPDLFSRSIHKLWCIGDLELLKLPKVSIVGTRNISPEGQARTIKLPAELVERGFCIVSGLAMGSIWWLTKLRSDVEEKLSLLWVRRLINAFRRKMHG
jgi:hypothetical protein